MLIGKKIQRVSITADGACALKQKTWQNLVSSIFKKENGKANKYFRLPG